MASTSKPARPTGPGIRSFLAQMYPPSPQYTEKEMPDLTGRVYIVTGANTGVGKEVASLLYSKNAKVYLAARSEDKTTDAIADIKKSWPQSDGELVYQKLDLADLSTVKASVNQFTDTKLHGLINNTTAQGHEIHLGVNVLGQFLFTKLLTPKLVATAKTEPANTVRVVWVSSLGLEMIGEQDYGITTKYVDYWPSLKPLERYGASKAGNWLYAVEFAKRHRNDGVVSVPCNPGHLSSELYRNGGALFKRVLNTLVLYPPRYGAYTELFSALSSEITMEQTGDRVVPWGRFYRLRPDLEAARKSEAEGGNGHSAKFWAWSEEQVAKYT